MTAQGGFAIAADPAASGGRCLASKGPLAAGQEAVAEIRVRAKQAAPYHLWVRLHWGHAVPSGAWVQAGDAPRWSGKDLRFSPSWQWVKVAVFEPADAPLSLKLGDAAGGLRYDQAVLTTDAEFAPEAR
jgi:hypothetical protein